MGETIKRVSPIALCYLSIQRRADDRAVLGIFGDDKSNAKAVLQFLKHAADGWQGGQIADQDNVLQTK